jgi:hypothetical protein
MSADSTLPGKTMGISSKANVLSLFTSLSTLICCALPALLVAIGAGAALAGLVSNVPQLIWISEHKMPVFGIAAAMLLLAGVLQWRARNAPCPADPQLAETCRGTRRNSLRVYLLSLAIFAIGAWFAFVAPLLA